MSGREGLKQIGKYPVARKLGEGATSEVWLCNDPFNLRDVAVKVAFTESFSDPTRGKVYRKLFLTEAKLAGKLQHPHICQIYDAVAEDTLHYLVMEYVDGGTLEKYCQPDALLPVERVVEIVFKCTRALEFAHKQGVTHRDIKPANILHTGETDVKITDFGAALLASGDTTQVAGVGSPAYMSPEQVKDHPLDHRTDIYSMGVVMYHLLTGRLPFSAENNFTLIYQIATSIPCRPRPSARACRPRSTPSCSARWRRTSPSATRAGRTFPPSSRRRSAPSTSARARRRNSPTPTASRPCAGCRSSRTSRTPSCGKSRAFRPGVTRAPAKR